MVKFIKKVLLFFALIAIIDIVCGFGFNYLKSHAKGGDTQKNYYISERCCDDILILGSSKAARHYDPQVFEDSLGMSCYNCGEPGCGIITAYARYGMIEPRHKPKLVLYEVTPSFDYLKTDVYSKYLGRVRQYATKPVVKQLFIDLNDELEGVRLYSNMYLNNSFIVHNVVDNLSKGVLEKGFMPLNGVLKQNAKSKPEYGEQPIDSIKLAYLERLIVDIKKDGIPLVFIASPRFIDYDGAILQNERLEPVIELCNKYKVLFVNHIYIEGISDNNELFNDLAHMNKKGVVVYNKIVCEELKQIMR